MAEDFGNPRQLGYGDFDLLLQVAADQPPGLTLVGGQALNFWAQRYLPYSPTLRQLEKVAPFLSGDLDFIGPLSKSVGAAHDAIDITGELSVAGQIARAVHGLLETKGLYGLEVTLATITYRVDGEDDPRIVHFLGDMKGVDPVCPSGRHA